MASQAFCIHKIPYLGQSYVVKLLTENYGIQSFFVKNQSYLQKKKGIVFQPLTLVEVDFDMSPYKSFQRWKDISLISSEIQPNVYTQAVQIFIAEVILKTYRVEERNVSLFLYLKELQTCLSADAKIRLVPIHFLTKYLEFLGLSPFALKNKAVFDHFFTHEEMVFLENLSNTDIQSIEIGTGSLSYTQQRALIRAMLNYYYSEEIKSPEILSWHVFEQIFSE